MDRPKLPHRGARADQEDYTTAAQQPALLLQLVNQGEEVLDFVSGEKGITLCRKLLEHVQQHGYVARGRPALGSSTEKRRYSAFESANVTNVTLSLETFPSRRPVQWW